MRSVRNDKLKVQDKSNSLGRLSVTRIQLPELFKLKRFLLLFFFRCNLKAGNIWGVRNKNSLAEKRKIFLNFAAVIAKVITESNHYDLSSSVSLVNFFEP